LPAPTAIGQLQGQQLTQQGRTIGLGHLGQVVFDPWSLARLPGGLEPIAQSVDVSRQGRVQGLPLGEGPLVHRATSPSQSVRINRSFRSTVVSAHPSFEAISPLVYPSSFHKATDRSVSSSSSSSSRRHSSAASAASSGVGAESRTSGRPCSAS